MNVHYMIFLSDISCFFSVTYKYFPKRPLALHYIAIVVHFLTTNVLLFGNWNSSFWYVLSYSCLWSLWINFTIHSVRLVRHSHMPVRYALSPLSFITFRYPPVLRCPVLYVCPCHIVYSWNIVSVLHAEYYTVNHKKRDILFLTITLANLNRFL